MGSCIGQVSNEGIDPIGYFETPIDQALHTPQLKAEIHFNDIEDQSQSISSELPPFGEVFSPKNDFNPPISQTFNEPLVTKQLTTHSQTSSAINISQTHSPTSCLCQIGSAHNYSYSTKQISDYRMRSLSESELLQSEIPVTAYRRRALTGKRRKSRAAIKAEEAEALRLILESQNYNLKQNVKDLLQKVSHLNKVLGFTAQSIAHK